jgi:hypothetical protein
MSKQHFNVNRRVFLGGLAGTTVSTTPAIAGRKDAECHLRLGPERPRTDAESWNIGIISAYRPDLSPSENLHRKMDLWDAFWDRYSLPLHLRGKFVPSPGAEPVEQHAFFLHSEADDSGNLKGFIRRIGRQFGIRSIIHKGYRRDVMLHALQDLPLLGMKDRETKSLGQFNPRHLARYIAVMTRAMALPNDVWAETRPSPDFIDENGGAWTDFGIWTQRTFFNRTSRQLPF